MADDIINDIIDECSNSTYRESRGYTDQLSIGALTVQIVNKHNLPSEDKNAFHQAHV